MLNTKISSSKRFTNGSANLTDSKSCFRHRQRLFLERRDISINDFLRVRTMTRDNTEKSFETTNYIYHVVDVYGARAGRKQWVHTWEGADYL